jgi:hypothetical protein
VASLTLLTTLLDFSDGGEVTHYVDEASVAAREKAIGGGGLLRGAELASAFSSLRANDLIWQYVVGNYLKGGKPAAFDLLYWNADSTNLPGPFAVWYLRHLYLENALREPGRLAMCGTTADLSRLDMPAYIYSSREDHIVPWKSAYLSRGHPRRRDDLRDGRQRPHRRRDQPAGSGQAQPLAQRRPGRRSRGLAGRRDRVQGQLVAALDRMAQAVRRRRARRAAKKRSAAGVTSRSRRRRDAMSRKKPSRGSGERGRRRQADPHQAKERRSCREWR